ncbi:MAG: polyhydroxyalkanoate synthesis regulator DNA-binding domain-containing protein [Myxococcales bacterium]|nr:polyhydroxyalkanoate synthesis regulator DNA-binding domain-containing protein [Polyangiaceae bacterium]MDW8248840.1 polyhydroxyalkanoate synthesis regulator DNA-binding domain-containing protein [Myxococcales bacterium]
MASLLIKKYPNRRLYDTSESQYITLEQLEERILAGADVQVVDAQTSEDLTQITLLQIIEKNGASQLLPVPLLLQLIRMRNDEALAEFLGRFLAIALEVYYHSRKGAQVISPLATLPFHATSALARLLLHPPWHVDPYPTPAAPPPTPPPPPPDPTASTSAELAELRRQIAELRSTLKTPRSLSRRRRSG